MSLRSLNVDSKYLKQPTRIYSVWICHVPYLSPSFFFLSTPDRPSKREKNVIAIPAREPLLWKNTLTNSVVKGERCVRATVRRQFIYLISLHSSFRSYQSRHQRSVTFPLPNFWYQASFYAINFIQVFLDTFNRSLLLIVYKFQLKFNLFQLNYVPKDYCRRLFSTYTISSSSYFPIRIQLLLSVDSSAEGSSLPSERSP